MIGLFYMCSLAFLFSSNMIFELFSWNAFFCYMWSTSLIIMVIMVLETVYNWHQMRQLEKWTREGEEDDDD